VAPEVAASGTFTSCTVWPGPNSMPVVNGNDVVVRAGTHSGPVTLESVSVSVPASAAVVVPGAALVDAPVAPPVAVVVPVVVVPVAVAPVVVGIGAGIVPTVDDVLVAAPPARLMAAPHVRVAAVFVTRTSVTISVRPAGTVNTVTAIVPAGTMREISTTFRTTDVPAVVSGDALGVAATVVGASGDVVVDGTVEVVSPVVV